MLSDDVFKWGGFAGLTLGIWVLLWAVFSIIERLKHQPNKLLGLRKIPASIWGMSVAHLGLGIFVIGVTHVNTYSLEKDVRLAPGQSYTMGAYTFKFDGVNQIREQNYTADEGKFIVASSTGNPFSLKPQKRFYSSGKPMTEAAINTTLGRDVYVSLGEDLKDAKGSWSVRLYLRSFVACIWLGGLLMALGGLLATADRRYRRPIKKISKQQLNDATSA